MQKTWFITGASRGFGRIWAEAALKRGDRVTTSLSRSMQILRPLGSLYYGRCSGRRSKCPSWIRGYTESDCGLGSRDRKAIRFAVERSFPLGVEFQCCDGRQRNCDEILDGCLHLIFAHEQGSLEADQIIGKRSEG